MQIALFGISSSGLSIVTNLLVLFLVMVYFALIYWTYLDARRRIEDPVLIACATAAALFPFLGTIIYTILRPPEFIEDRHERELEIRASELRVRELIEQSCPHCEYPVERNFMRCPNCERKLKNPCRNCKKPLDPKWGVCPYCETEVRKKKPPPAAEQQPRSQRESQARRERRERRERAQQRTKRPAGEQRPQRQQRQSSQRPAQQRQGGGGSSGSGSSQQGSGQPTRPAVQRSEGRSRDTGQWPER
jgi:hypothetical protein